MKYSELVEEALTSARGFLTIDQLTMVESAERLHRQGIISSILAIADRLDALRSSVDNLSRKFGMKTLI